MPGAGENGGGTWRKAVSIGGILVEIMATGIGEGLMEPIPLMGTFPSRRRRASPAAQAAVNCLLARLAGRRIPRTPVSEYLYPKLAAGRSRPDAGGPAIAAIQRVLTRYRQAAAALPGAPPEGQ